MAEFSSHHRLDPPFGTQDHVRGSEDAPVTMVLYGDYQCPFTARVVPILEEILDDEGESIRFTYRNFPLNDIHPDAQPAAEAAEAAAAQGRFWEMYWTLFGHYSRLDAAALVQYARDVGLDESRFIRDLESRVFHSKVRDDFAGGQRSGVESTPTLFMNGLRYDGKNEADAIRAALRHAPSSP